MIAAHGHAAPETGAAFRRAHELAAGDSDVSERNSVNYGLWAGSYVRGEFDAMRDAAQALLADSASQPHAGEASVAHRTFGVTEWFAGSFIDARGHLEQALAIFDPERDRDLAFRFGQDVGVSATAYLSIVLWPLGELDRARELVDRMTTRFEGLGHLATSTYGMMHRLMFEIVAGNVGRAAPVATALSSVARQHGINLWISFGAFSEAWAELHSGPPDTALANIRRAVDLFRQNGIGIFQPLGWTSQAEAEALTGETAAALATIERALTDADRSGQRWYDAEINRTRGEILLKKDPADPSSAEDAFLAAIAVAQHQKARSFELRAALSLAKLYQATARPADAHAVLAPALEGFVPTPEMPEIAEAQTLLAALAKNERVREALERRQARAKMHLDYARAVQWAKGWGAEEARAAVERAHEFAPPTPGHPDYWSLTYSRFGVALLRGEFRGAFEIAKTYLRQAEVEGRPDHVVNAGRLLGTVKLELGAFLESRQEFEKLLQDWDEDRDKGLRAATGADVLCVGWAYMAQLMVILGEVDDAVRMSEGAIRRAEFLGDFGSLAFALGLSLFVLAMCGRNEATLHGRRGAGRNRVARHHGRKA